MEEDPLALWNSLKERYDQQRAVMLPEAQREWSLIRFQDFKSVAAYNSAVHKVNSKLRFCNQAISEEDLIEKTLCTFHPSMRVLQQQYRQQKYKKYSELIYTLLQAEKHDELLMKNHQTRPTGSMPLPEAHANTQSTKKYGGIKRISRNSMERGKGTTSRKHLVNLKVKVILRKMTETPNPRFVKGVDVLTIVLANVELLSI